MSRDNGATILCFVGGAISTVIGTALYATTSDTNAQIVESMKPTPLSQLQDELKITPSAAAAPTSSLRSSNGSSDDIDANAPVTRSKYALVEGKSACPDELRSKLSGYSWSLLVPYSNVWMLLELFYCNNSVPCCYSRWQSQADKYSRGNDKWLPISLNAGASASMRVLWDTESRLPLVRAQDKRHWGTKVLGFLVGYSEREDILPRDHYMFTLGEGRHKHDLLTVNHYV
jgi:hypothetical protein